MQPFNMLNLSWPVALLYKAKQRVDGRGTQGGRFKDEMFPRLPP